MNICEKMGDTVIITMPPEIDDYEMESIRINMNPLFEDIRVRNVIFDFAGTSFMDSSGIGLITGYFRKAYDRHGGVYLVNVDERLKKVLSMSGILRITKLETSIEEAYKSAQENKKREGK